MGAASFTCSTLLPLMMASSSNSRAQPSLPTLNTMASIPKCCAAICVLKRVRMLGFKNNSPMRLLRPFVLCMNGSALYAIASFAKALISLTSFAETNRAMPDGGIWSSSFDSKPIS